MIDETQAKDDEKTDDGKVISIAEGKKPTETELFIAGVQSELKNYGYEFFHDEQERAFASVPVNGHWETFEIRSREFRLRVLKTLYDKFGCTDMKVARKIIEHFEVIAICGSPEKKVHVRIAREGESVFLDLGDSEHIVIEMTKDDWSIQRGCSEPKFLRPQGLRAHPLPEEGGKLSDLCAFMNVERKYQVLIFAWLSYIMAGREAPFPILVVNGNQGTGKSTVTTVCVRLTDPSVTELQSIPSSERDLAIRASKLHLLTLDNMSDISSELSDWLCRMSTGSSFRTRRMRANDDELLIKYRRPVTFNSIEELIVRGDLLDRSIIIGLKQLEHRKDVLPAFEKARPKLLGALLDTVCHGLRTVDSIPHIDDVRMTDFARWGVAVEEFMGFEKGEFLASYRSNIEDGNANALDASPIAQALYYFLTKGERRAFDGSALELLHELRNYVDSRAQFGLKQLLKHPKFPKSATQLGGELSRIEPSLKKLGITFSRDRINTGRLIHIRSDAAPPPVQPEQPSGRESRRRAFVEKHPEHAKLKNSELDNLIQQELRQAEKDEHEKRKQAYLAKQTNKSAAPESPAEMANNLGATV